MNTFDKYVFRNLLIATLFVCVSLIVVIMLTQSLRFLELVIESGASSISFWILTLLAVPRFLEIILPLSLMAATLFVYNRMAGDSELAAIRSLGSSPYALARPAIALALGATVILWFFTMWAAPKSLSQMQSMRQIIQSQFSSFFLREGIFNKLGEDLTVYIQQRNTNNELEGIIIHDARGINGGDSQNPATVIAQRGALLSRNSGFEVLVYDGSRQSYDPATGVLQRLNFERYTVELPGNAPLGDRWREPNERTILELLNPDMSDVSDIRNARELRVEIHHRLTAPLLALSFTLIACMPLLIGAVTRRGYSRRIALAIAAVMVLQSLFLAASNIARQNDLGIALMYLITTGPVLLCFFFLSAPSEKLRHYLLQKLEKAA